MKLRLSTDLNCSVDEAFNWVSTPKLLLHVARPLIVFKPLEPAEFPQVWVVGDYRVRMLFLGLIPLGEQVVGIRIEPEHQQPGEHYQFLDDGHSRLIQRWHHLIRLEATPGGTTRYTDELEIEAGLLSKPVWLFAWFYYRYRQYRWRRLAQNRFEPLHTHEYS